MKNEEILTIQEILKKSSAFLTKKGVENPKLDSELIISETLEKKRMELFLNYRDIVQKEHIKLIRERLIKRGKRIPLQHILGKVSFAGISLRCDPRALIPRQETELLVDQSIKVLGKNFSGRILDMGTGSGAIILSLCSTFKEAKGVGIDSSKEAVDLAVLNGKLNNCEDRVTFHNIDWYKNFHSIGTFDFLVSNPPYLSLQEWENTSPEVKHHDPRCALVSEEEGMAEIMHIIKVSKNLLHIGGYLALEIGMGQAEKTLRALEGNFKDIVSFCDLNGVRRFVWGRFG